MTQMTQNNQHDIVLRAGEMELTLAPETGAGLLSWRWRGIDIVTPTPQPMLGRNKAPVLGGFPLIPYSNRIGHGGFRWAERFWPIRRNTPNHRSPLHGNAWQSAWRVQSSTAEQARLVLEYGGEDPQAWPFAYRATMTISVADRRVTIALSIENRGRGAMPAGLGFHPFFPLTDDATLRFAAERVWLSDSMNLPVRREKVPDQWNAAEGRRARDMTLDNCFDGWDGSATITWPKRGVRLEIEAEPAFGHLVVYIPPDKDIFATEPATHMNNAMHHRHVADNGMRCLAPGQMMQATIRFDITPMESDSKNN